MVSEPPPWRRMAARPRESWAAKRLSSSGWAGACCGRVVVGEDSRRKWRWVEVRARAAAVLSLRAPVFEAPCSRKLAFCGVAAEEMAVAGVVRGCPAGL